MKTKLKIKWQSKHKESAIIQGSEKEWKQGIFFEIMNVL